MESSTNVMETDRWMDEVAKLQEMLVERDVLAGGRHAALLRLRRAHLFYPAEKRLQEDVQVRCNFVKRGIAEGDFTDTPLHDSTGESLLLSQALDGAGSQRVLLVGAAVFVLSALGPLQTRALAFLKMLSVVNPISKLFAAIFLC